MEDIEKQLEQLIKECQEIIIQNTIDLDEQTRSKVFSRFNGLRYKLLTEEEAKKNYSDMANWALAVYTADKCISFFGEKVLNRNLKHTLLHEMIHAVTDETDQKNIYVDSGFRSIRAYKQDNKMCFFRNIALCEAATEFYAATFLNDYKNSSYEFLTSIYSYLSRQIGYNTLKEIFFEGNLQKFKDTVSNHFHLPNNKLVERLLFQMNMTLTAFCDREMTEKSFNLYSQCCMALIQMNYYKIKYENPNLKEEQIRSCINVSDIITTIPEKTEFQNMTAFFNLQLLDFLKNFKTLKCNSNKYYQYETEILYINNILNNQEFNDLIKDYLKANLTDILLRFDSIHSIIQGENLFDGSGIFYALLNQIRNENGKLDLSYLTDIEKYYTMNYLLNGQFSKTIVPKYMFENKDLIDYVNFGRENISTFVYDEITSKQIYKNDDKINSNIKEKSEYYKIINDRYKLKEKLEEKKEK